MTRARSLAEISEQVRVRHQGFDPAVREFLDAWQSMSASQRSAALRSEPESLGRIEDAYLGALAEHLALSHKLRVPQWTESTNRFLDEPFFAGGLESLKAALLVESPLAFRRRQIFISENALSRPARRAVQPS